MRQIDKGQGRMDILTEAEKQTYTLSRPSNDETLRITLCKLGDHVEMNMVDFLVCPTTIVLKNIVLLGALQAVGE